MNAIGARALLFRPAAALRQHTAGLTSAAIASSSRTLQVQQPVPTASLLFNNPQRRAYHEVALDHFNNPRNVGKLDKKSKSVGSATVGKASCGDVIRLDIEVEKDAKTGQEVIKDAKFKTFGCGSAIASSSYATERVIGAGLKEAEGLKNTDISQHLSLPPVKIHCSVLAEEAIQAAIADYKRKQAEGGGK
jgi:nitrogen fixation NifU-like protein